MKMDKLKEQIKYCQDVCAVLRKILNLFELKGEDTKNNYFYELSLEVLKRLDLVLINLDCLVPKKEKIEGEYKFEVGKSYEALNMMDKSIVTAELTEINVDEDFYVEVSDSDETKYFVGIGGIAVHCCGDYVMFANGIPDEYKPDAKDKDGGE